MRSFPSPIFIVVPEHRPHHDQAIHALTKQQVAEQARARILESFGRAGYKVFPVFSSVKAILAAVCTTVGVAGLMSFHRRPIGLGRNKSATCSLVKVEWITPNNAKVTIVEIRCPTLPQDDFLTLGHRRPLLTLLGKGPPVGAPKGRVGVDDQSKIELSHTKLGGRPGRGLGARNHCQCRDLVTARAGLPLEPLGANIHDWYGACAAEGPLGPLVACKN